MAAESPRMIKIVLTGGPCGGKTTALAQLSDAFTNAGWKVYRVPEAATVLIPGGVDFAHLDREDAMQFQVNIVRTMMTLEQTYMDLAMVEMRKLKRNVAIIHDRGIMDSHSCNYHLLSCLDMQTQDDWENLLQRVGLNAASASTERYDCVIHLRSAAMGAEKFYQLGNNQARTEGIAQARQLDEACTRAWMSHGHYFVVDNSVKDFASKLDVVVNLALKQAGLADPRTGLIKHKYVLEDIHNFPLMPLNNMVEYQLDYHFIPAASQHQAHLRLRLRHQAGSTPFYTLTHRDEPTGLERRRAINEREYQEHLRQAPNATRLQLSRRCFMLNGQYWQVQLIPQRNMLLVETWTTAGTIPQLPPFLEQARLIGESERPAYSLHRLAK